MSDKLFREKNLEQISSPDHLAEYLHVTGPGVWLVLVSIVLILGGMIVWGIFGKLVTNVTAPAIVRDNTISCYIRENDINLEDPEIHIRIGDVEMLAEPSDNNRKTMDATDDPSLYKSGYLQQGQSVIVLRTDCYLNDGYYEAVVTTESLHPISFLFSR